MRNLFLLLIPFSVVAVDRTVCASGCTHTTINAALSASACGDTVLVSAAETHTAGDGLTGSTNPIVLDKVCSAANPITLTTSEYAKLPPAGARITPSYAESPRVVPLIRNPVYGFILRTAVGASHARGYVLRGLEFYQEPSASGFSEFVSIGTDGQGTSSPDILAITDTPEDIVIDQVIIRGSILAQNLRHALTMDGRRITVKNSWIAMTDFGCCGGGDSQAIQSFHGHDLLIWNNFISGGTETVNLSGGCSSIHSPRLSGLAKCATATSGEFPRRVRAEHNLIEHPSWQIIEPWSAAARVPLGKFIKATALNQWFQAQGAGVTGGTEPTWPTTLNATVVDGGVTWKNRTGFLPNVKNLFEAKAVEDLELSNNGFYRSSPQNGQGFAWTITSRSGNGNGGGPFSYIRNVRIENNVVADVPILFNGAAYNTNENSMEAYASIFAAVDPPYNISAGVNDKLRVSLEGGAAFDITLTAGAARTAQNIVDDINAAIAARPVGERKGIACAMEGAFIFRQTESSPVVSSCNGQINRAGGGLGTSISVEAVANSAYATLGWPVAGTVRRWCNHPRTGVFTGCGELSNLRIVNNLAYRMNVAPYLANVGYMMLLSSAIRNAVVERNTLDVAKGTYPNAVNSGPTFADLTVPNSSVFIRNNVFGVRDGAITAGAVTMASGTVYDFSAINYGMCNAVVTDTTPAADTACPAGVWSGNLFPSVPLHTATMMNTVPVANNIGFAKIPSDNWSDPITSVPFRRAKAERETAGDFRLTTGYPTLSKFTRGGHGGVTPGVDYSRLPRIEALQVQASDRAAVLTWMVSDPLADIPCAVLASTSIDLSPSVTSLNPGAGGSPESDLADRLPRGRFSRAMTITGLSASTEYFYELQCGGGRSTGSFTTSVAVTGNTTVSISRAAAPAGTANVALITGTGYSRATGTISGAATVTAACTAGSVCTVSASIARGSPVYQRIEYRDAGAAVLRSEPVRLVVP